MEEIVNILLGIRSKGVRLALDDSGLNLKVKGRIENLSRSDKESLKQYKADIISLLKKAWDAEDTRIMPAGQREYYPLSSAQKRIWVLSQFEEGKIAYNIPGVYTIVGEMDLPGLEYAFKALIIRHEILRTVFREDGDGEVCQYIQSPEALPFRIACFDLRNDLNKEETVRQRVQDAVRLPFDLENGPLLRADLFQLSAASWVFAFTMHHIISDGWSMNVLIRELMQYYTAYSKEGAPSLPPLRIQYKDYSVWQQDQLLSGSLQPHKDYWLDQFQGELPVLDLPSGKRRPAIKTYNGGLVTRPVSPRLIEGMNALCHEQGGTLFMGLLATVNALLYGYTNKEDIIVGTAIAGRDQVDLEGQIGFYVNTLALRTRFRGEESYRELFKQIKEVTLGAYAHQAYPFDELINALPLQRDMSRNALFDVMVVLQNAQDKDGSPQQRQDGLIIQEYKAVEDLVSKFDMTFMFIESGDELQVCLKYNSDIYDLITVERMAGHFIQLLETVLSDPDQRVGSLSFITEKEQQQVLSFNRVVAVPQPLKTVTELFDTQAAAFPERIALVFGGKAISYAELNDRSSRFGDYLRKVYDIQPGNIIGIRSGRSEWMVIALLGILRSGGAYLPIDPEWPKERVDLLVAESACRTVISDQDLDRFRSEESIYSAASCPSVNRPDDPAYVIFTSGSSGRPKGVIIEHRSLVNYFFAIRAEYGLGPEDRVLQISNFTFDASVEQIFVSLLSGAVLYIIDKDLAMGEDELSDFIQSRRITHLHATPTLLQRIDLRKIDSLKRVVSAGENCPPSLINGVGSGVAFYNKYGPTEATISVTIFRSEEEDAGSRLSVPIGHPINNVAIYITGRCGQLLPVGVAGEICIGGESLARGYLNSPELTAEKFVADRYNPGGRMYRTGDLGRWLPDGNIEFAGRRDEQLKIRGYRIEPGEIENALLQQEDIDSAIVTARAVGHSGHSEKELVAYLISEKTLNVTDIRKNLARLLPAYMIPSHFIQSDTLPLTSTGKIDRRRMPEMELRDIPPVTDHTGPRNETEEQLVAIWQEVLGNERIGVKDNFFELGGHSLKVTRLASLIHKAFNVRLRLQDLFADFILEDQAELIRQARKTAFSAIAPAPVQQGYPLSSAQRRLWVLSQFEERNIAYNLPSVFVFEGELNRAALDFAFATLIERHEILRTVFREDNNGALYQFIQSASTSGFKIDYQEIGSDKNGGALLRNAIHEGAVRPFDLSAGPLLRASLYRLSPDKWIFSFTMHHIIGDGWSKNILIRELLSFYNSNCKGTVPALEPLRIQYKDYAFWQQTELQGSSFQGHKQYWLKQFEGELPVSGLPADKLRPAVKTYNGGLISKTINERVTNGIRQLVREQGSTLFMGLLAGVNILLYRYTGQEDIIIGSPIAGREHADLDDQIGCYLNTLALRIRFKGTDSYRMLLDHIKEITMSAYEHQVYPFDELVDALDVQRDASRNPLFDVTVALQNAAMGSTGAGKGAGGLVTAGALDEGRLTVKEYGDRESLVSKFDLSIDLVETGGEIQVSWVYNSDIYQRSSIERMADHFGQLLEAILSDPAKPINSLEFLLDGERNQLLRSFNHTAILYPGEGTIVSLFEQQATRTPDKIALVYGDKQITYAELDQLANRLAHYLRQEQGIMAEDRVGLLLDRSDRLIIAILGILKAGAAYVPIDPAYPMARTAFILQDTGAKVLITQTDYLFEVDYYTGALFAIDVQLGSLPQVEQAPVLVIKPSNLAYVMYTSGSTGMPKGVLVEHKSVVRLVRSANYIQLTGEETLLSTGAVSFDATTFEYWGMLLNGGRLVICSQEVLLDSRQLKEEIRTQQIDTMWFTSGWLNQLVDLDPDVFTGLRTILAGGDKLSLVHIEALRRQHREITIINGYGPTENTTFSLAYRIGQELELSLTGIPIGSPISNSTVYIVDPQGLLAPVGVVGEICVGGTGLSRGYLNNPELTGEKFVPNPFQEGERMYRTGDLGRWLPDGNIAFIGRVDDQVKVRGFRVELGEIEEVLQSYPDIRAAVVLARADERGEKELVAYMVCDGAIELSVLRSFLGNSLPAHMVPAYYVELDELPLNPNGKVDRKRLLDQEGGLVSAGKSYTGPRNAIEEQLVLIWQEVLGRDRIGVKDDFFEQGGHSLKATRLASLIHKTFDVKVELKDLFSLVVLEEQAKLISQAKKTSFDPILPAPARPDYPLSSSQRRLWVLSQFEEGSIAYNIPGVHVFEAKPDRQALDYAFAVLIARHEILRTVFKEDEKGEVRQYILSPEAAKLTIAYTDLRKDALKEKKTREWIRGESRRPFDLENGPLLRAGLVQLTDDKWVFAYTMHHIISDGWSMGIMIRELLSCYNAYDGCSELFPSSSLPPLRIQYKDYAFWQQDQLQTGAFEAHKTYWLEQLGGELPVLELPGDRPRPAVKSFNGGSVSWQLGAGLTQELKALSQEQGGTLFMGLVAAINVLLYKYTGQEDIIIGSPIAGREHADLDDQIGFYVNTLALRMRFSGQDSYVNLLGNARQIMFAAYKHQAYPFDALVDILPIQRDMSRNALFDVMVVLQNADGNNTEVKGLGGLKEGSYNVLDGTGATDLTVSKFDLLFNFIESAEGLEASIGYNSDIYDKASIVRMTDHIKQLLEALIKAPSIPIQQAGLLNNDERQQLLVAFNDTAADLPRHKTLTDLFEEQVERTPDRIALVFEENELTYEELNERADQLSDYLIREHEIQAGDLVGIKLGRSEWMIVAILGILKTGGAYVPVNPDYPAARIDHILTDSRCKTVIDTEALEQFMSKREQYNGPDRVRSVGPGDLAYVMYTSGSTGKPKGVMIEHASVVNAVSAQKEVFGMGSDERVLQFSDISFDASVEQIFIAITSGACLVLIAKETLLEPGKLEAFIDRQKITHIHMVPGILKTLEIRKYACLRRVISGGDRCPKELAQKWSSYHLFYNEYGPTETTITSIEYFYSENRETQPVLPIGRPIANTSVYILREGEVVPVGVIGEICIGGAGLARGYLNRPELTAEKFIPDPFDPGGRMYRTGDLGRWLPDGNIEFTGRLDDQVKIRGYRIETGEIERTLQGYEKITSAFVLAMPGVDGEKELVAYITGVASLNTSDIRTYLSKSLPAYMLPALYIQLDELPLTPTGKVDRKRLPDPQGREISAGREYVAPRNPTEAQLVSIWQEVLGRDRIGIRDDFFESGGHSLKATRLVSQIHKVFQVKVALKDVFVRTILEDQAALISRSSITSFRTIPSLPVQDHYTLSSSQRRLWVLSQFEEASVAYNMPGVYVFEGTLDKTALERAFGALIERHEILRTVFWEDDNGEVRQLIRPSADSGFALVHHDMLFNAPGEVHKAVREAAAQPFDLSTGPLLRSALFQTAEYRWVFLYNMHHIISDGWSMDIFLHELLLLYKAYCNGEENPLLPLRVQYKEYAAWQQERLSGESLDRHKAYWLGQFQGELPVFEGLTDKIRPALQTYNGGRVYRSIDQGLSKGLEDLSRQQGGTLFMGLLATVNTLLFKYTRQTDIVIGSPIAGRGHADLEDQIGFYVNTLALRAQFKGQDSFRELLDNIRQITLAAYEHQDYPFDDLVDALPLQRDLSRNVLFDIMIVFQNAGMNDARELQVPEGLTVGRYEAAEVLTSKFDLLFDFIMIAGALQVRIDYNSDIYNRSTVERLADHFGQLLNDIVSHPDKPIERLDLLNEKEKEQLLLTFNNTGHSLTDDQTIVDLFEEQAKRTPDNIAVSYEGNHLTYRELDELTNRLAYQLVTQYAVRPDCVIGIEMERGERFIVAVLGVLKSGAAYLPIDPDYPEERIAFLKQDSNCLVTITPAYYEHFLAQYDQLPQHKDAIFQAAQSGLAHPAGPENLVYLIYTSGSTGNPKGIMMPHRSMVNLIRFHINEFPGDEVRAVLQFASISFDVSFQEIFSTLLRGATLYPIAEATKKDATGLADFIVEQQVDTIFLPTAYFKLLIEDEYFLTNIDQTVRHIIVAGEQLIVNASFIAFFQRSRLTLHNHYGPAETHVVTTYRSGEANRGFLTRVPPIGKPVDNTRIYLLDDHQSLIPIGAAGEICIGGACLSRGYLNRESLTKEKFIPDPYRKGALLYRTGDLGRWQEDGTLTYIGRKDFQVKIRGYRVELGEIEYVLQQYPSMDNALVLAREKANGDKTLIAYFTGKKEIDIPGLRSFLAGKLPHYMVPSHYIQLDELPLTSNGKVDRRKLPAPEESGRDDTGIAYVPPRDAIEEGLVEVWQEILSRQQVGIRDNFFDLGGHSLKATTMLNKLKHKFGVRITLKEVFQAPNIQDLAEAVRQKTGALIPGADQKIGESAGTDTGQSEDIQRAKELPHYPLSSSQRRIWVLSQFEEGNAAYNISAVHVFEGSLDMEALAYAFKMLTDRHEILRTVFRQAENGEVRQFIQSPEEAGFRIGYVDMRKEGGSEEKIRDLVGKECVRTFNLSSGTLLRGSLYQVADDQWIFCYVMHHIISDGWSMRVLIDELLVFYNAYISHEESSLAPLPIQYKDYAVWQQAQLAGGSQSIHKNYWLKQFEGELPVLELPGDKIRPSVKTYNGRTISGTINARTSKGLKSLCRQQESTMFMGLLAAINVLLFRYTNAEDIVIGSPVAGRQHLALESQIGLYVNTLALRTRFKGENNYKELLEITRQVVLDVYEHQAYPFDELIDDLQLRRDISRNPLFDVAMIFQDYDADNAGALMDSDVLTVKRYMGLESQISKFDLLFSFVETDGALQVSIEYNSDIYDSRTAVQLIDHLDHLLEVAIACPDQPVNELDFLSEREKHQQLTLFNDTTTAYPADKTIATLFREQADRTPDNTALVFADNAFTYKELNRRTDLLAGFLRQDHGVGVGDLVGILLDRSEYIIIAILGILKAGAAYVPIDPAYPIARREFIMQDTGIKVLITKKDHRAGLEDYQGAVVSVDDLSAGSESAVSMPEGQPDDLAYVMYTSGSTGVPKGVMVTNRSVVRLVRSTNYISFDGSEVLLSTGAVSFDATTFEYWGMLLNGGRLVMCPGEVLLDAKKLSEEIRTRAVNIMWFTAGWLNQLVDVDIKIFDGLKTIFAGGDKLSPSHISRLRREYPDVTIINGYGPTENTTFSLAYRMEPAPATSLASIPIGRPISNSSVYILDARGRLLPIGAIGEICVGGAGLARGYLSNDGLTAEKFVPDPFREGERMYKTGDCGRWLPDGNIDYLGRIDDQVKIRGHRIELGEIEHALKNYTGIDSAVVIARTDAGGDKELVAYIVSRNTLNIPEIRSYLINLLPAYMLPGYFVGLDELPLTANGKVDRRKLPDPDELSLSTGVDYVAPRNEIEEQLVSIWQEILGKEKIGVKDNFFESGGHSVKAIRLIARISKQFDVDHSLARLFANPTIEDIAEEIEKFNWANMDTIEVQDSADTENFYI